MLKSESETPKKKVAKKTAASGSEPKPSRTTTRSKKKTAAAETPAPTETRAAESSRELPPAGPSHTEIARRAYELYLSRGGKNGAAADDWLRAEQELRGDKRKPGNA